MTVLEWCVTAGLAMGAAVYLLEERRRRRLASELESVRAAATLCAARVDELQRYAGEQAELLTNAYAERAALLADSDDLRRKLRDLQRS